MFSELKNNIQNLRIENTQFNVNDVLVNVDNTNQNLFFTDEQLVFSLADFPKRILNETTRLIKESGVNALCCTNTLVELQIGDKSVETPVLFTPLEFKINKQKKQLTLKKFEDEEFINPFLLFHLNQTLEITTPEEVSEITSFLIENEFILHSSDKIIIGNFHHHRYQIVKELDELLTLNEHASTLKRLLGFGSMEEPKELNLLADNLFFADADHEKVFESLNLTDCVVQGPPGTGKSQVLSNILGKLVAKNKTTIVVSEKKAALEVLKKKLSNFNLDQLCFIATSDRLGRTFFKELKETWDYFENFNPTHTTNIRLSEQYLAQLQMTLDLISQDDLIGGIGFSEFFETTQSMKLEKSTYNSHVDSISHFKEVRQVIKLAYEENLNSVLGGLKQSTLNSSSFSQLDKKIDEWITSLNTLQQIFEFNEWIDLQQLTKEAIQCQIFENEYYKKYSALFTPNSKAQKKFITLRKKFNRLLIERKQIESENSHWKIIPSEVETISLLQSIQKSTFTKRFKTKKRWKEITHLPFEIAQKELEVHLKNLQTLKTISHLTVEFCELGVESPEINVEQIYTTINAISETEWDTLSKIPIEKRTKITSSHHLLERLQRDLQTYFNLNETDDVLKYLKALRSVFGKLLSLIHI